MMPLNVACVGISLGFGARLCAMNGSEICLRVCVRACVCDWYSRRALLFYLFCKASSSASVEATLHLSQCSAAAETTGMQLSPSSSLYSLSLSQPVFLSLCSLFPLLLLSVPDSTINPGKKK